MSASILMVALWLPGAVVYPPQTIPLEFAHGAHRATPCERCHLAASSTTTADRLLPAEAVCAECHGDWVNDVNACNRCHPGYRPMVMEGTDRRQVSPWPAPIELPPAPLHFNHRRHGQAGVQCTACHGDLSQVGTATRAHLPSMAQCVDCHRRESVSTACTTCHPARPDGRLRTRFDHGRLRPEGHGTDFLRHHGVAARAPTSDCDQCHTPSTCQSCHADRVRPASIHPADYLHQHAVDARTAAMECGQCHRQATFCVDCHTQAGVTTARNGLHFGRTPGARRFHPPGFVDDDGQIGRGHHGRAARRNISTCVSCHREDDCVRCHADDPAAPIHASPHPAGFQCGRALDLNPRSCLKCHGDLERLRSRCPP